MNLPEMTPKNLYATAAAMLGSVVLVAGIAVTAGDGSAPTPDGSPSATQSPSTTSSPSPESTSKSSPSSATSGTSKPSSQTPGRKPTLKPSGSSTTGSTKAPDAPHCPGGEFCDGDDGSGLSELGKLIAQLPYAAEVTDGYEREAFSYSSVTRDKVLAQEKRADGTWLSLWDNKVTNDPALLQIDHTVALKEAWDSGAYKWSADKRKAFANDTTRPETLRAITGTLNQSKSAQDGAWAAPYERCQYVSDVAHIKKYWGLSVDHVERQAMLQVSEECVGSDN